ncbi:MULTISPECIES: DUF4756 family protein [Citrobacter]|uniref:DUF4756 family protein n=1 Tax=Citrobacter TaxID=544 RepID=UPI001038C9D1|nr:MULTISPECIES: DUF4756 family protein [Citrobacter]MBJ9265043.1 DUF4756 family protein [Citrobacter braakii]MBN4807634.1 DUF4756 family protein [Citrobacter braakii]MBN4813326.1 DUF4756 family protein [Citrobacter braakii]MBN4822825.1 DUF4756 family protein [Citrobacter braakii]MBN4836683.1 DUF4756 family protein [Citrobacter braakii]
MKNIQLDNSDIIDYLKTIEELKKYPSMAEYRQQYGELRRDNAPTAVTKQFYSAHTMLRRLDKKKNNLLGSFISELNPVKREHTLESVERRSLARALIREKSDDEIVSMLINQRTEAALELQRAVEQGLEKLAELTSAREHQQTPRRKISP